MSIRGPTGPWLRARLNDLFPILLVAAGISAFYLGLYVAKRYSLPIGWDTPRYLGQTNFVAERGLRGVPHLLPPPAKTLPGRPGFAIVSLSLSSVLHASTFKIAVFVPIVATVALSLAGAAFISWTLEVGAWESALVAAVVGTSAVAVRLIAPETYTDNLIAAALFAAALLPVVSSVRDGPGTLPAILLLALGGLTHPQTFWQMLAVLFLAAVAYGRGSWLAWRREGMGLFATPSGRLAAIAGGALGASSVGTFGLLRVGPDTPFLLRQDLEEKLREDVPLYRFPITLPLAALGAAALATKGTRSVGGQTSTRRFVLVLMGAWTVVAGLGVLAFVVGLRSPAHRFLAFLLPIPLLAGVALLGLRRLLAARGAKLMGLCAALIALAGLALLGYRDLYEVLPSQRGVEWLTADKVNDARLAGAYLEAARVPDSSPVVFVIDDTGPNPIAYVPEMAYFVRSVLPPERVLHTYFYVGDPEKYLAGQPTYRSDPPTYNENVDRFWPAVQKVFPEHPVALVLSAYSPFYEGLAAEHPEWIAAPDLVVLRGPQPTTAISLSPSPYRIRGTRELVLMGGMALILITALGLGWAAAMLPERTRPFEVLALSPAFGLGFLIAGGLLADQIGVRLTGMGGIGVVAVVGVAGLLVGSPRVKRSLSGRR